MIQSPLNIKRVEYRRLSGHKSADRRTLYGVLAFALCGLLLAACSSASASTRQAGSTSNAARPSGTGKLSGATLASLKAVINRAEKPPTFAAPGPPVNALKVKGDSALIMPITSEIGTCRTQATDLKSLGTALGMRMSVFSNSGLPSQWTSGIEDAISAHDSAIAMFCGIIPGVVAPQLRAARNAGIKIIDGEYNEVSNYTYLNGETPANFVGMLRDDVDAAFINLDGSPIHALDVTTNSIVQGPAATAEVAKHIHSLCPKMCSVVQTIDVPAANWATQVQSDVAAALVAHPSINVIFVNFDGMTNFVLPAVEQAHRPGLKIYTAGGSASVIKLMLSTNSLVEADPGGEPEWEAYAEMDQLIRVLTDHPAAPVQKEFLPYVFLTPTNASQFFGPGDTYSNTAFDSKMIINGFRHLWGLAPLAG